MMFSCFYNEKNKVLVVTSNDIVTTSKVENNDLLFFNKEDELIGANISCDLNIDSGIVDIDFLELDNDIIKKFQNHDKPFCYGYIKEMEKHPKSDRLNVCVVDVLGEEKQIVCGASNCSSDKVVIVARVGAVLPNGLKIKPSKVHGVDSYGMLCSYKELGINKEGEGIVLFDDKSLLDKAIFN